MTRTEPEYQYKVRISVKPLGGDVASFLDMLRYERAVVIDWTHLTALTTHESTSVFEVTLRSKHPVPERWHSFMITPYIVEGQPLNDYNLHSARHV